MTYPAQLESALAILARTGIMQSNYAPPIYRLLWRAGVKAPPPHFAKFHFNVLFTGACFAAGFGVFVWLFSWSGSGTSAASAAATSLLAGLLFGLSMALYYRYGARKHKLPAWSQLPRHS